MPSSGTDDAPPQVWVTALVHLGLGLLWSWRLGKGTANEREHLRHLTATLPRGALLVADAGYVGYELLQALLAARLSFLIRLTSRAPLYVPSKSTLKKYREGLVYYWPQTMQRQELPPIPVAVTEVITNVHIFSIFSIFFPFSFLIRSDFASLFTLRDLLCILVFTSLIQRAAVAGRLEEFVVQIDLLCGGWSPCDARTQIGSIPISTWRSFPDRLLAKAA